MSWPWQVALVACVVLLHYYFIQALRNLAPDHPESIWRILLWSKFFARRDNFTHLGWRYRNRALFLFVACTVLLLFGGTFS